MIGEDGCYLSGSAYLTNGYNQIASEDCWLQDGCWLLTGWLQDGYMMIVSRLQTDRNVVRPTSCTPPSSTELMRCLCDCYRPVLDNVVSLN